MANNEMTASEMLRNKVITNREDMYLAKIAGLDIDLSTIVPDAPINARETILLDIAKRIDQLDGVSKDVEYLSIGEWDGEEVLFANPTMLDELSGSKVILYRDNNVLYIFEGLTGGGVATFHDTTGNREKVQWETREAMEYMYRVNNKTVS